MKKPANQTAKAKAKKRTGRPPFAATDAHRRKVKSLREAGCTEPEIAGALGITEPTLRKYFAAELEYQPTSADRRYVSIAAGGGMSAKEIALALGIPISRLKKHFADELTAGAMARRAEVLQAMYAAARKGNVSAQRAYLSAVIARQGEGETASPGAPKLGKKEQAQAEAETATAGTDWDGLLPPADAVLQ